jgi:hypothetical protein
MAERTPRYAVVTYCFDSGFDEKLDYRTLKAARSAAKRYLGLVIPYDGVGIWDRKENHYCEVIGHFPVVDLLKSAK